MINVINDTITVNFSAWDAESYKVFLQSKKLPEYNLEYDWKTDSYTLKTPARFAHVFGLDNVFVDRGWLPFNEKLFDYQLHDTHISIWEDTVDKKSFMTVYGTVIRHLRDRGFHISKDPRIKKNYPILSRSHRRGYKKHLEVKVELSGRILRINFFQNLVTVNRNGGEYDFDRYKKMPYLIQKQYLLEAVKLIDMLTETFGYSYSKNMTIAPEGVTTLQRILTAIKGIHPSANPLARFNKAWTAERFERDDTGWPVPSEYDHGANKDRDGVNLRNGMFRYHRDHHGYLKRGKIYTNMNFMWQLIYGPGRDDVTYVSLGELFKLSEKDCRKRYFDKKYQQKRIRQELDKAVKIMNFEKAIILRDLCEEN